MSQQSVEPPWSALSPEQRRAKIEAIAGKYADLPTSSELFIARKREEIERIE